MNDYRKDALTELVAVNSLWPPSTHPSYLLLVIADHWARAIVFAVLSLKSTNRCDTGECEVCKAARNPE